MAVRAADVLHRSIVSASASCASPDALGEAVRCGFATTDAACTLEHMGCTCTVVLIADGLLWTGAPAHAARPAPNEPSCVLTEAPARLDRRAHNPPPLAIAYAA